MSTQGYMQTDPAATATSVGTTSAPASSAQMDDSSQVGLAQLAAATATLLGPLPAFHPQAVAMKHIQDVCDALMAKDLDLVVKTCWNYEKMKTLHDSQKEIKTLRANIEKVKKQRAKAKDELDKAKAKNIAASATAVAAALSNQLVGFVADTVIETDEAEQRGSIDGQKLLFGHIVNDLNELEVVRGSDMVCTAGDLELYKKKHNIPDY
ncbi:hypothetical protein BDP81DRAFT_474747 [Colletotrichum phormii]|uniref:Uncharacterized protein n=1 Tax=Colletotrichum phormii TaxID=359342 RepID=A0AAI9ZHJ2_9PEZI|nr:uncharacterized protein BDP81DRAFT_474747 [Colletotrichum phormii]KAK1624596.1 hypothetical protein BDP81DRAFT_474747 [Colletotrichum phormii]